MREQSEGRQNQLFVGLSIFRQQSVKLCVFIVRIKQLSNDVVHLNFCLYVLKREREREVGGVTIAEMIAFYFN